MKKKIEKIINKLALDVTGYDIFGIEDYKTPDEAIEAHLDWLKLHSTEIYQQFEREAQKYKKEI